MFWKRAKQEVKQEVKEKIAIPDCGLICPRDEKKCAKWVVLYQTTTKSDGEKVTTADGRCTWTWLPPLFVELIQTIKGKLNDNPK